jgi:hypothetical protein
LLDNLVNYQNIRNILNYKNSILNKDINSFLNENIKNKIKYLMNKLNESMNEISLIYNIKNNHNEIKLFDKKFIKNNRDNCILSINNKIMDICEYYILDEEIED